MTEVKYNKDHHAGATPEARIANRMRNSGEGSGASSHVVHGTGPTRSHTNLHSTGNVKAHGELGDGDMGDA